jgi:hypothetical protein
MMLILLAVSVLFLAYVVNHISNIELPENLKNR